MAHQEIRVLHIDTEKTWRGGQQQAFYLHKGLIEENIFSLMICNPNSELKKRCEQSNFPHIIIKMRNEIDLLAAFEISRVCKKENISILQAHSAHALSIGIIKLIGVRRVDFHIGTNIFSKWKYNTSLINKIVAISTGIRKVLKQDGISDSRIETIHSAIDIDKFKFTVTNNEIRKKHNIHENNLIVGTTAAFVGHKDYPNLINAAKKVINEFEGVTFMVLGDGPLKAEMVRLVKDLNILKGIK